MKKYKYIYAFILICIFCAGFNSISRNADEWIQLFNGRDLSGWNVFLGPKFDESGNKSNEKPFGLNNDPAHVFSVVDMDGEKAIRVSGEIFGAITTKKEYENYHLQLLFKWGELTWGPKKIKRKTVAYYIMQLVSKVLQMAVTGCVPRNFRSRKRIAVIIGELPAPWKTFQQTKKMILNMFIIRQANGILSEKTIKPEDIA